MNLTVCVQIARHRADAEQQRLELQKMHSAETERLLEKVGTTQCGSK